MAQDLPRNRQTEIRIQRHLGVMLMGLQQDLQTRTVDQLQIRQAITVDPDTSVRDAVREMRQHDLGCVFIIDADRKPVGVFSESLLTELIAHHPQALDEPVKQHMAAQVPWVRGSDPVVFVLEAMQLKNVRLLCVVDDQDRVIGLTGQRGLMEFVAEYFPGDVTVQRLGLPPYLADREGV